MPSPGRPTGDGLIARLRGKLLDKRPGLAVVDVAGVGYEVTIPLPTFRALGEIGGGADLHVHTHVREDTLALFGFITPLEKDLFVRLVGVNGVGPKTAIALLSGLGADDLVDALRRRNLKALSQVPGVGRKTAERISLELADRLESLMPAGDGAGGRAAGGDRPTLRDDLISALVNLGYNARVATETADDALLAAVPGASPPAFETLLKGALRSLRR